LVSYASCGQANGGGVGTNPSIITLGGGATAINVISINDTVVVLDPVTGAEAKAIVLATNTATAIGGAGSAQITVQSFTGTTLTAQGITASAANATGGLKVFVYGSAYTKGTTIGGALNIGAGQGNTPNSAVRQSVEPQLTQFSNSPIIIRDQYVVSGSDMAQIGWVEVATEDGTSG